MVEVADPSETIFEPVVSRRMQAEVEDEVLGGQPLDLNASAANGHCPLPQAIDIYAERIRRIFNLLSVAAVHDRFPRPRQPVLRHK